MASYRGRKQSDASLGLNLQGKLSIQPRKVSPRDEGAHLWQPEVAGMNGLPMLCVLHTPPCGFFSPRAKRELTATSTALESSAVWGGLAQATGVTSVSRASPVERVGPPLSRNQFAATYGAHAVSVDVYLQHLFQSNGASEVSYDVLIRPTLHDLLSIAEAQRI